MMKRLMALVTALCVFAGVFFTVPAALAENTTMYVVSNTLAVYVTPDTSAKKLGTIGFGESLTCTATSGNWAKVKNAAGATGYCALNSLSASNPNTMNVTAVINAANTPIYKIPSESAAVWLKLNKGTTFTAVAMTRDNTWVRLKNGKYYGYVQAKHLSTASGASPTPTPTAAPPSNLSGTVYASVTSLPVYKSASASAKTLGNLYYGQSITCTAVSGGWAKVKNAAGTTGYCQISGLTKSDPNNLSQTVYINTDNAPVYKKPSTTAAVWAKLKKDASFTAVAVTPDGTWTRIKNGGNYAYILTKYLSDSAPTPKPTATPAPTQSVTGTVYAAANTVTIYQTASTSGKSLGVLSYGESATALNSTGSWAQIKTTAGVTGYCALSGLSTRNPNTYAQTVYIAVDNAPVYRTPSADASVWTKLKKNAAYTAVAITPDGNWVRIQNGNKYAYISAKNVTTSEPSDGTEQTVYITATALTVYASASTSAKSLGTAYLGQSMSMIGASDGWAKVRNPAGTMGYCLVSGLSTKDPNTLNKSYYAKNTGVKLYQKPSTGATVVKTVAQNTSLLAVCLSSDGLWARIALGDSSFAYAQVNDLSATRIDDGTLIADIPPVAVYPVNTSLTVYASASTASKSLGTVYFGQSVTCTGKSATWARVVNNAGVTGYCDVNAVTTTNPNIYSTVLYAQAGGAKVYQKPLASSKVLATLGLNAQITGVAYNSDRTWYRVKSGSTYGYAETPYFATTPMTDGAQSGAIAKVVALAKQYLGVPYVYAGQSPSGFDCSGFTYYIFKNAAGISLKRTAYSQGYDDTYPKITNKADLKVGDILFFNTVDDDDACDHAGIYLGNNQFIHASSGGGKVMISSLGKSTKDYYYRTYSWARRIIR